MCTCQPRNTLSEALYNRIRPFNVAGYAFWCDKTGSA